MPQFQYSRWDGSQEFSPQSADKVFDQISEYMMQYGDQVLDLIEQLEQDNPEILDMLMKQGYLLIHRILFRVKAY